MFNVIRIPTKFSRTIKRFSEKQKCELLDSLISIGTGNLVTISDSVVGDTISLIYGEWMNMESKSGKKPKLSLINNSSESLAETCPSDSGTRVEYSRVEESRVEESREGVVPKVTTLETYIKREFTSEFITDIYNKYKIPKEDFKEECELFVAYRKEKSINGKKERWEKEKTFDPKLRFRTWMKNNKKWSNRVFISSDDEEINRKLKEIEEKKKLLFNKI